MELFVAGLVLGVLLTLCASGRGDARMVHGHQPKVPPADWVDWAHVERPPGSAAMPPRRPPPPDPGLISYDDRPRGVR
jgi:hypothetical protein